MQVSNRTDVRSGQTFHITIFSPSTRYNTITSFIKNLLFLNALRNCKTISDASFNECDLRYLGFFKSSEDFMSSLTGFLLNFFPQKNWTGRDLNPKPSPCKGDVIPGLTTSPHDCKGAIEYYEHNI